MSKVPPIFVHPGPELRARLDAYKERTGWTRAEIVRRALDQYLEEKEEKNAKVRDRSSVAPHGR